MKKDMSVRSFYRLFLIVFLLVLFLSNLNNTQNSVARAQAPLTNTPIQKDIALTPSSKKLQAVQESENILSADIEYNFLYASAYTDLWQIDPYSGTGGKIGSIGYEGTDIAFDGKTLYGVTFTQLLSIDPTTGTGSVIGNIGFGGVNALTVGPDGTMYAGTGYGELLRIDKTNGTGTYIGSYGSGLGSSGDLAIRYDNKMYASIKRSGSFNDWLAEIDPDTGRATPIGDIGETDVYGLDFKDWSLYGVTSAGHLLEINTETGESTRIETFPADFWGLSTSGPALSGSITSPPDNYLTGPASLAINATAQYPGGKYLNQVEFYVEFDGIWHSLGNDPTDPYSSGWEMPLNLNSQQALLRIDVIGTDNQDQVQRASYAGGVRRVNVLQSMGNPDVVENWVPVRAYLNQRSLGENGDSKCNVSSIAMVLAMDGHIDADYLSMANKANSLAPQLFPNPGVTKECNALKSAVSTAYCSGRKSQNDGWDILKSSIDNGHPIIVDSRPGAVTRAGHYAVAVGYKEAFGKHYMITYDPFGEWTGQYERWYYNKSNDPASHVGKWVYYEFEEFTGSDVYLFATVDPSSTMNALSVDPSQLTPPDTVSEELRVGTVYIGQSNTATFNDVSIDHWAWNYVERLYSAGITGGCSVNPLSYCPNNSVTRAQMAVFLEKGLHYPVDFAPPNVAPTFNDTAGHWAEDWIEALRGDGITGGCGSNMYCPNNPVTRAQMAIFLLKSKYGSSYTPPAVGASTGFNDVPITHWAAPWIKQLAAESITGGCGGGNYCPNNPVTRAQMAVFLVKTFSLP